MNIEKVCAYARENGLPEKRIEELKGYLHPDENGELDTMEAMEAMRAISESARAREMTRSLLEAGRAARQEQK